VSPSEEWKRDISWGGNRAGPAATPDAATAFRFERLVIDGLGFGRSSLPIAKQAEFPVPSPPATVVVDSLLESTFCRHAVEAKNERFWERAKNSSKTAGL
jgi:hypothetical protein